MPARSLAFVTLGYPMGIQAKNMVPAEIEFILMIAPVLATDSTEREIILGVTKVAELSDLSLLTNIFVTIFPTSWRLHEVKN